MTTSQPSAGRPGYTIAGGRADADRLSRQATVMAEATAAFLARLGLRPGWSCLDVGCGTGQVSLHLARAVAPSGRVIGCDLDAAALDVARGLAEKAGARIDFEVGDITSRLPVTGGFDLAYARLVLSHLADPMTALRTMAGAVKPGGIVAVEDLYTGTLRSEPPARALDDLQEIYSATVRFSGGDPTIGPRLPAMLAAAGLTDITQDTVENPMTTVGEKLFLAELVDNMRVAILASGAASAAEVDAVRAAVAVAAEDPATTFFQARIHQVAGRTP